MSKNPRMVALSIAAALSLGGAAYAAQSSLHAPSRASVTPPPGNTHVKQLAAETKRLLTTANRASHAVQSGPHRGPFYTASRYGTVMRQLHAAVKGCVRGGVPQRFSAVKPGCLYLAKAASVDAGRVILIQRRSDGLVIETIISAHSTRTVKFRPTARERTRSISAVVTARAG